MCSTTVPKHISDDGASTGRGRDEPTVSGGTTSAGASWLSAACTICTGMAVTGTSSSTHPVRWGGEVAADAASLGLEHTPARRGTAAVGSRPHVVPTRGAATAGGGAWKTASERTGRLTDN
jgi:hypothetical protein